MTHFVRMSSWVAAILLAVLPSIGTAQSNCQPVLTAETSAGAMVKLSLSSSCHANAAATIHHSGMMVSTMLDGNGGFALDFPAMTEAALFMVELDDGAVAVASTEVPSLSFYDRVALQWQGEAGLELHAREFGADYMTEGHVWRGAPRSMDYAALGEGGFLVALGSPAVIGAQRAEVYTFPTATTRQNGEISLTVEAVVGEGNCNQSIEANALRTERDRGLNVRTVTIEIPSCEASGDILVLNNLIENLIIGNN